MVDVITRDFLLPLELIASVVLGLIGSAAGCYLIRVPSRSGR